MGLYDTVKLEDDIELPNFDRNPQDVEWQSKTIGRPAMIIYKLTNDGKLLERKTSTRKMTEEEMLEHSNEKGYDSWEEWEEADTFGPLESWKYVTDEEWWENTHRHGSFEIHGITDRKSDDSTYWSYEVRFTKGKLDEILLLNKS